MKVKELIERLQKLDPESEVVCYSEDPALLPDGCGFVLLEIEDVDEREAKPIRIKDNIPYLDFEYGAPKQALISVTSDF